MKNEPIADAEIYLAVFTKLLREQLKGKTHVSLSEIIELDSLGHILLPNPFEIRLREAGVTPQAGAYRITELLTFLKNAYCEDVCTPPTFTLQVYCLVIRDYATSPEFLEFMEAVDKIRRLFYSHVSRLPESPT